MFGFGFNKDKSRAAAERYLQQNKLQNAVNEYEKILKVEPQDLAILNQVGDIYARLGQNEKAIERFKIVGEAYLSEGYTLKAIAMYRKITKLDTNGLAAMEKLAELYRKQGLVSDSRAMLLQAADAYTRRGQNKETLRLLRQLVLFDPENVQVITRTADLMVQGGQRNEARDMLAQTASTLVDRRALEPAKKILERLLNLDKTNIRAQELRAQVTLELGDPEAAIGFYQELPDLDDRLPALQHLLQAHIRLNQLDQAEVVARKLCALHHDNEGILKVAALLYQENLTRHALELYQEFAAEVLATGKEDVLAHLHGAVSRVRNEVDLLEIIYSLFQHAGESTAFAEMLELLAQAAVQSEQLERARDAYKDLIELEPENAAHVQAYRQVCSRLDPTVEPQIPTFAPRTSSGPRTLDDYFQDDEPELPRQSYTPHFEEIIATALTEAELSESFASKESGVLALESALRAVPDNLRLNRSLAQLYTQAGNATGAARCYATMQRVLESMGEANAAAYYATRTGAGQTTTWEGGVAEFSTDGASHTEEIDLSSEWESVWQGDVAPAESTPPAKSVPLTPASAQELLEEVRFCLSQQIWNEAESAIQRLALAAPNHPELPTLRAQLRRASSSSAAPVEVIEVAPEPRRATPPPVAPSLSSLASELDAELGDTFDPSPQPRREPAPRPAIAAQTPPPPPGQWMAPVAPAPAASAAQPSVFGNLLHDFESELAAPPEENEDPETHFNLGIAFREMGLLDEAIGELQKVCRLAGHGLNPQRAQQAYIWLATCFVEKSVPEASLKWYHKALEAAADEESRTAVNYELASAYEAAGMKQEALAHFVEVYGSNIDYRDVATRIRELRTAL